MTPTPAELIAELDALHAKSTQGEWLTEPMLQRRDWEPMRPSGCLTIPGVVRNRVHNMRCDDAAFCASVHNYYPALALLVKRLMETLRDIAAECNMPSLEESVSYCDRSRTIIETRDAARAALQAALEPVEINDVTS